MIGEWNQRTDDDDTHAPGANRTYQNVAFHAFGTHAQNAVRRQELFNQALAGPGSLSNLGIFFHFLQDSYSHYDYAGNRRIGHGAGGHSPDHPNTNLEKARKMIAETWFWLNEFGRRKNLCCKKEGPDWGKVEQFINIGYDLSTKQGGTTTFGRSYPTINCVARLNCSEYHGAVGTAEVVPKRMY